MTRLVARLAAASLIGPPAWAESKTLRISSIPDEAPTELQRKFGVLEEDLPLFGFARNRAEFVIVAERYRPAVKNILWHQARLPGLVRRLGLDVLHVPSYRRLLWRKPCALVATIHDLAQFHVSGKYDPARMFYGKVIVRRLAPAPGRGHRHKQLHGRISNGSLASRAPGSASFSTASITSGFAPAILTPPMPPKTPPRTVGS